MTLKNGWPFKLFIPHHYHTLCRTAKGHWAVQWWQWLGRCWGIEWQRIG